MSWYYVDAQGQTQGGFDIPVMKQKFASKECTLESYVWNGTSVNQWTPLKQVDELLNQIKPAQAAPARKPARRRPAFGGGRGNFLASIQKGAQLKKVEPKKEEAKKPAAKKGGGMDFMSQLKMAQAKRGGGASKSKIGGVKPKTGGVKPKPAGGGWKAKQAAKANANPKPAAGGWKAKQAAKANASGGSKSAQINRIKSKLDSAQEWQLKAIDKILS